MTKKSRHYRWLQRILNNDVRLDQYPVDGDWSPKLWRSYYRYMLRIKKPIHRLLRYQK